MKSFIKALIFLLITFEGYAIKDVVIYPVNQDAYVQEHRNYLSLTNERYYSLVATSTEEDAYFGLRCTNRGFIYAGLFAEKNATKAIQSNQFLGQNIRNFNCIEALGNLVNEINKSSHPVIVHDLESGEISVQSN